MYVVKLLFTITKLQPPKKPNIQKNDLLFISQNSLRLIKKAKLVSKQGCQALFLFQEFKSVDKE